MCAFVAMGRAQNAPSGMVTTLDLSQNFEYSDNPDFQTNGAEEGFSRTTLNFGLDTATRLQRFRFNLGGDIEVGRNDQSGVDARNPFFALSYDRVTRNASLRADASYRESDILADLTDVLIDLDGNLITQDRVARRITGYGLEAAVGQEAPVGASFSWRYNEIDYAASATNLTDRDNSDLRGQIDFRINPKLTTSLIARYSEFDAQGNGVSRETVGLGASAAMELSRVLSADLSLSYDRIERSGDETATDEGFSVGAGLTRAMPDGSWRVAFSSDVASNDDGRRSQLTVSRQMELPRGDLSYSLGLTGTEIVGYDPLASMDYVHRMPSAQINLGLTQRVATDINNNEQINTSLRAGFEQQINNASSFGVSVSFFNLNRLSDVGNDVQRVDLSLTYRHELTRDWGLVSGISHARVTEDNLPDRRRNTVFVGLERSFAWSP